MNYNNELYSIRQEIALKNPVPGLLNSRLNERATCVSSVFNNVFRENIQAEVEYVNKHIADLSNRETDLVRWTNAYQVKKA